MVRKRFPAFTRYSLAHMPTYAAILGHQPHLSQAELAAVLPGFKQKKIIAKHILLFESSADIDAKSFRRLGGSIAIAREIASDRRSLDSLPQLLHRELSSVRGKVTFSLRAVGLPPGEHRELYRSCKTYLRNQGRPSRYVGNERKPTPSVLLHDAGLLSGQHGCELVILKEGDLLWIGRTVTAQDIAAYTKRDMEKPVRDTGVGLLPPKLAQILLNFGAWLANENRGKGTAVRGPDGPSPQARASEPTAGPEREDRGKGRDSLSATSRSQSLVVYDPFCGSGVIPMECLLRGWAICASDKEQKAVNGCAKNLEWLRKEEKIFKKDVGSALWKHDALKPFDFDRVKDEGIRSLPHVIVTETSLGPVFAKRPTAAQIQRALHEAEKLEAGFLKNVAASLPGVPVVCTWPVWFSGESSKTLEKIWDVLHTCGFQATLPPGIKPFLPKRLSLLYRRPEQFVGREIVMLRSRKS